MSIVKMSQLNAVMMAFAIIAMAIGLGLYYRPTTIIVNDVSGVDLGTEYMITVPAETWNINDIEEVLNQLTR